MTQPDLLPVDDKEAQAWANKLTVNGDTILFEKATVTAWGIEWLKMVRGGFQRLLADRARDKERLAELEQREQEHLGLLGWARSYLTGDELPDEDVDCLIDGLVALETGELPAFQRFEQGLRVRIAELEMQLAACATAAHWIPGYQEVVDLHRKVDRAEDALTDAARFVTETRGRLRLWTPYTPDGLYQTCDGCGAETTRPAPLIHGEDCLAVLAEKILKFSPSPMPMPCPRCGVAHWPDDGCAATCPGAAAGSSA